MSYVLEARDLSFAWHNQPQLFRGVSFGLEAGEMLGITGPSGCGKSTLCLCLGGIIPNHISGVLTGGVYLLGQLLSTMQPAAVAAQLGIVFQDPETQLFLPVIRNELAFGPENLCVPRDEIARRVKRVAADFGIAHLLPNAPTEISGGQQQIAALAAVLAMEPKVLLLDEVTSQLDRRSCQRLQDIIKDLKKQGVAIVMVEHNHNQLLHCDRVFSMDGGWLGGEEKTNE